MPAAVEKLLRRYAPGVRAIGLALRRTVLKAAPRTVEVVRPGRRAMMYGTDEGMKAVFYIIHPERAWVNLAFSRGTDLKDPRKLLEGTGKRIRHVRVKTARDATAPALRALVVQAAKLTPSRK